MTALIAAAERTRADVVEYLVTRPEVTLEEKIDALELLGASYANDKDNYSLDMSFQYLYQTMLLRLVSDLYFFSFKLFRYKIITLEHSVHALP